MKILVFLSVVACVLANTRWHQLDNYSFEKYVKEFGKKYSPEEYNNRKEIFENRLNSIREHNRDSNQTWKKGVNHLSDRTQKEFNGLLGLRKDILYNTKRMDKSPEIISRSIGQLPPSVDWRQQGIISAVKDQGQCGSCWSFATAETIEAYWALATGQLTDLSEQQVLDCTPNPNDCGGTGGCGGGTTELAYANLIQMDGIATEWTYPYTSYFGQNNQCHVVFSPFAVLKNYTGLPTNQYAPIMQAIATVGPLAVAVDASSWGEYESGVFNGCNQTNPDLDHAVQLVGYGTDPKLGDYWLIKNSWSPAWGESGYVRLLRQTSNQVCGVDIHPSDGEGCKGGPSKITVCGTCGILYDANYVEVDAD